MKKLYATFLLLLVIVIEASGQGTDNPILPRIYEEGYSIEQIENFALENNSYSYSYRTKLLTIVNEGLRKSGEDINVNGGQPLNESHITWIYEQVKRKANGYLPIGYSNTWRDGNLVRSSKGKKSYYGPIDQFIFNTCTINLDKPSCANLLGDMELSLFKQFNPTQKKIQEKQTEDSGWGYEKTQKSDRSMIAFDEPTEPSLYIPNTTTTTKKVVDWIKVGKIGGLSVGVVGAGILAYSLLSKKIGGGPIDAPPVGGDQGGPQDGQPVGGP